MNHREARDPAHIRAWDRCRAAGRYVHRRGEPLRRQLGYRGAALLVFAFIDYILGWMLLDSTNVALTRRTPSYAALYVAAPPWVWALLWLTVALVCTVQAFARRHDEAAFIGAIGIKAVWASGMLAAWIFYSAPRAWLGASLWAVLAALVAIIAGWPEPRARDHDG